jgi:hypothetical protein
MDIRLATLTYPVRLIALMVKLRIIPMGDEVVNSKQ